MPCSDSIELIRRSRGRYASVDTLNTSPKFLCCDRFEIIDQACDSASRTPIGIRSKELLNTGCFLQQCWKLFPR